MPANSDIVDDFVVRAINLERFKGAERIKALRLLKSLEDDLVVALAAKDYTNWTKARLQSLLVQVRVTIATAYKKMRDRLSQDFTHLVDLESQFVVDAINGAIGVDLLTVEFSAQQLRSIMSDALIEGAPSAEWWSRQAARTEQVFADTVRKGILMGQTTDKIVTSLRRDVFSGMLRRNVEAIVRSSVQTVASDARLAVFEQNDDVIGWVQWHSTLDPRTCARCQVMSGLRWNLPDYEPIGHKFKFEHPALHWGCRCVILPGLPIFDQIGDPLGKKDMQRADRIFKNKLRAQGMGDAQIAVARRDAQASMDGYVPASMSYEDWLETKPVAFQKSVLGPQRWKLWNDGKISFSELVNRDGDPLTIEDLRRLAA